MTGAAVLRRALSSRKYRKADGPAIAVNAGIKLYFLAPPSLAKCQRALPAAGVQGGA